MNSDTHAAFVKLAGDDPLLTKAVNDPLFMIAFKDYISFHATFVDKGISRDKAREVMRSFAQGFYDNE